MNLIPSAYRKKVRKDRYLELAMFGLLIGFVLSIFTYVKTKYTYILKNEYYQALQEILHTEDVVQVKETAKFLTEKTRELAYWEKKMKEIANQSTVTVTQLDNLVNNIPLGAQLVYLTIQAQSEEIGISLKMTSILEGMEYIATLRAFYPDKKINFTWKEGVEKEKIEEEKILFQIQLIPKNILEEEVEAYQVDKDLFFSYGD
jgi:Tfp pilus assembly protein PilN